MAIEQTSSNLKPKAHGAWKEVSKPGAKLKVFTIQLSDRWRRRLTIQARPAPSWSALRRA